MTRTAIIAAMPGELKPLVRGWQAESRDGVNIWRRRIDKGEWVAACAGAGVNAATRAFAEVEKDGPIHSVISIGWAGALSKEFAAGQAYWIAGVIDAQSGERLAASGFEIPAGIEEVLTHPSRKDKDAARVGHPDVWLVTSPVVADEAEKLRLAATYGAGLVDMEAAAIARLAQMRGIPFYCVKGISDGYREQLPDFNRFILPDGGFKLVRFIVFAVIRPRYWPALVRMGENSKRASQSIAKSLLDILEP